MAVTYQTEKNLNEQFFEDAFNHEMNGDISETVFSAFCAAMNHREDRIRDIRIDLIAKMLHRHDAAEDWLAVADKVRSMNVEKG